MTAAAAADIAAAADAGNYHLGKAILDMKMKKQWYHAQCKKSFVHEQEIDIHNICSKLENIFPEWW